MILLKSWPQDKGKLPGLSTCGVIPLIWVTPSQLEGAALASLGERLIPFEIHRADSLAEHIRLNDACLALGQAYTGDTELHVEILDGLGGDLRAFIERLEQAASAEDPRAAFFGAVADSG